MSHVLRLGVVDQIAYFRAFNTDGSAKADFTSATGGASLSVFRAGLSSVAIASLSNKAADSTAHADGAIRNVGGNLYTLDLPDAATADQCPSVGVRGSYTGGVIEPVPHPLVAYNPTAAAVGALTSLGATAPSGWIDAAAITQSFPTNFAALEINASGHVGRVTLVDTTTTNTDMRGTDAAMLAASYTAAPSTVAIADEVRTELATELARIDVAISSVSGGGGGGGTDWTADERTAIRSVLGIPASGTTPATPAAGALHSLATAIDALPTTAEFEARTLIAAQYATAADAADYYYSLEANQIQIISGVTNIRINRTLPIAEYATAAAVTNVQGRLPAALVSGRIDAHIGSGSGGGGATPEEIWTHASRTLTSATAEVSVDVEELAAAIAAELTSSGLYRLTVSVVDGNADAVPGVVLAILGVAGTTRTTGAAGEGLIDLDPGTYSLRVTVPAGYEPVADTAVTIDGADSTATVTLVATTPTPPTNPLMSRLDVLCLDAAGEAEAGVEVDARIVSVPTGSTNTAFKANKQTATSGVDGIATFEAPKGAKYQIKRGTGADWQTITIGSTDVTTISSFIGSP